METRVTIGDFSRASQLTVKTLRHYHDVGLLEPSEVDPGNGYRYYSEDQIPVAQVIRRLRDLQMPVADVRSVLGSPDPEARNLLIAAHLDRLEQDLAATSAAVGELRGLLERGRAPQAVTHRTVSATPAIAVHEFVDREDILAWWHGALGELHAIVRAQGLEPAGAAGGVYAAEIFQFGHGEATVYIPTESSARAIGRVEPLVIPPAELAIMLHHGPLDSADLTYGELAAHAMSHEISVEGPLRENYLVGFLDTEDPAGWKTEIGWPIFRSDASEQRSASAGVRP